MTLLPDGIDADFFTLESPRGLRLRVSNYGGVVSELHAPDREGHLADVALGFEAIKRYCEGSPYFGAIIGRYGNRLGRAQFELEGKTYTLAANNGRNCLHGGKIGFDKVVWEATEVSGEKFVGLELRYRSRDGEEGFPGNLDTKVTYRVTHDNTWEIRYEATTDQPTVINLTQHAYFNLAGHSAGAILDHRIKIAADSFTPVDEHLIPTGEVRSVSGTPFDLREPQRIGDVIELSDDQLALGLGFDHNFVLAEVPGELKAAALAWDPASGRSLQVRTTEPGMQFYTGNNLDGSHIGKDGACYDRRTGFCFETQHFPDSPNQPNFPSTRLDPGQVFRSQTNYSFGVVD